MALLPKITMRGVPGSGQQVSHAAGIRRNYNTLAQGLGDISKVAEAIEVDRLNEQADQVAHDYELASINADASEFTKQFYSADDPELAGLNIRTREKYAGPNGDMLERNRENIPADEVWPELLGRTKENLKAAHGERIESEKRRNEFMKTVEQEQAQDNLKLMTKSAEAQYARGIEQRKDMAVAYREMGRWDKIYEMIDGVKNPEEKSALREWAEPLEVVDHNTEIIGGAMETLDKEPLQQEYDKYLGYMARPDSYSGPLNQQELEKEAHRFKSHMGQIDTANNANGKMIWKELKYETRLALDALKGGQYVTTDELIKLGDQLKFATEMDPNSETMYNLNEDMKLAVYANEQFREVIGTIPEGQTIADKLNQWRQDRDSLATSKDPRAAKVMSQVNSMIKTFETRLNSNPMDTLRAYELDQINPIEPMNFDNFETIADQASAREYDYNYYQDLYEYDADILGRNERANLNTLMADETVTLDSHLLLSREIYKGMSQNYEKFWAPSISNKEAGMGAALGMLMTDWTTIGAPDQGFNIARTVQRGFARWKDDPTIVQDYQAVRESTRTQLSQSYVNFPGMMDNYLDMAMAYSIANNKAKYVKKKDIVEALNIVTGGMVEQGGRSFMTPDPSVNSVTWDEYLNEYSPTNITQPLQGWTAEQVTEGIRTDNLNLVPTGFSRNSFYVTDPRQPSRSGIKNADGTPFVFTYDKNAEKRHVDFR